MGDRFCDFRSVGVVVQTMVGHSSIHLLEYFFRVLKATQILMFSRSISIVIILSLFLCHFKSKCGLQVMLKIFVFVEQMDNQILNIFQTFLVVLLISSAHFY
jgi:hypothetical protein